MAEFEIKHLKSPQYSTAVATGMGLGGPTGDGFVHMTFFRDIFTLQSERFESIETRTTAGHATEIKLGRPIPTPATLEREDVVTISIPADKLRSFADALAAHAALLEAQAPDSAE